MKNKRIKSFTLLELLISITILIIVFFISSIILKIFLNENRTILNRNNRLIELVLFTNGLSNNFKKFNTIEWDENHLIFTKLDDKILYSFENEYVILNNVNMSICDTFYFEVFELESQKYDNMENLNLVRSFEFKVKEFESYGKFFFYKKYLFGDFINY